MPRRIGREPSFEVEEVADSEPERRRSVSNVHDQRVEPGAGAQDPARATRSKYWQQPADAQPNSGSGVGSSKHAGVSSSSSKPLGSFQRLNALGVQLSGDRGSPAARTVPLDDSVIDLCSSEGGSSTGLRPSSEGSADEDDEDDDSSQALRYRTKLNHFRYHSTSARSSASSGNSPSDMPPPPPLPPPVAARIQRTSSTPAFDIREADLKRLAACVSCQARWTIRKTPREKAKHIRACAKKNGLTDVTVNILVQQALSSSSSSSSSSSASSPKGKEPDQAAPADPKTYLEELAGEPKRKGGKRAAVQTTVQAPAAVSATIARRAAALLGTGPAACPSDSNRDTAGPPPPTQAFGASSLAQRNARPDRRANGARLWDADADAAEPVPPPATQAFGRSKLGSVFSRTSSNAASGLTIELSDTDAGPPPDASSPARSLAVVQLRSNSSHSPSGGGGGCSPTSIRSRRSSGPARYHSDGDEDEEGRDDGGSDPWAHLNDDVYLHYEPDWGVPVGPTNISSRDVERDDDAQIPSEARQEPPSPEYPDFFNAKQQTPEDASSSRPETNAAPLIAPSVENATITAEKPRSKKRAARDPATEPATKTKTKSTSSSAVPEDDAAFDRALRAALVRDVELHRRILRYEPIAFDVFLARATDAFGGPPSRAQGGMGKFKTRVKRFLDQQGASADGDGAQAIQFYGADGAPGRNRARRR
ncbi:hypothetical protein PUNSTDRAFT_142372 [Punctularia strigosozonata HHB-11173 SS5]|uniref:uncharacterized protein n=1 Tax=Punctularia strigosozonata (strain HHB-11173) TaxID=741275 RepID=UPI0004418606|nr:uncharacterized protein PUNSTDRAFT_142372 [Punctularia strigosozonata HHB-11173 SS5]EIN10325.1 hypothetical protein PUNSTDRAFT_142372 [Punctularia strigosozonata HHB-11173 SS5]